MVIVFNSMFSVFFKLTIISIKGAQNKAIIDKLGLQNLPDIAIFKRNTSEPIYFSFESVTKATLVRFLSEHTSFYMRAPGNIESLDKLALKFVQAETDDKITILAQGEEIVAKLADGQGKKDAEYYIKVSTEK